MPLAYLFDLHMTCLYFLSTYLSCRGSLSGISQFDTNIGIQFLDALSGSVGYTLVRSVSKVLLLYVFTEVLLGTLATAFCFVPNISIGSGISMSIFILLFVYIPPRIGLSALVSPGCTLPRMQA